MPVKAKCLAKYLDLTRLTLLTKVEVLDLDWTLYLTKQMYIYAFLWNTEV
jgi:hypothetical protein